jgi:small subunit ribosomal protein S8
MTKDLISNMLTNIRNASKVLHTCTYCEYSTLTLNIIKIFTLENYIDNYSLEYQKNGQKLIKIDLKYMGWWIKKPTFSILKRISKSGNRVFSSYKNLKENTNLLNFSRGIAIISTSSGIMTHNKAIKLKKGGEILCYIE